MDDTELRKLAEWIVETCLLFGSSVHTAYQVAATFVAGLPSSRPTPTAGD